mgnify:FL=1|tara:strand:+ start:1957 stop:2139 length:183 start_codon:yes stop_codon:yes gene_type:complete
MMIAKFITGPGTEQTPYNVKITFLEYILAKVNSAHFLEKLSNKYNKDFTNNYYYEGVKIC